MSTWRGDEPGTGPSPTVRAVGTSPGEPSTDTVVRKVPPAGRLTVAAQVPARPRRSSALTGARAHAHRSVTVIEPGSTGLSTRPARPGTTGGGAVVLGPGRAGESVRRTATPRAGAAPKAAPTRR